MGALKLVNSNTSFHLSDTASPMAIKIAMSVTFPPGKMSLGCHQSSPTTYKPNYTRFNCRNRCDRHGQNSRFVVATRLRFRHPKNYITRTSKLFFKCWHKANVSMKNILQVRKTVQFGNQKFRDPSPRRNLDTFRLRDVQCRSQDMAEGIHEHPSRHKVSMIFERGCGRAKNIYLSRLARARNEQTVQIPSGTQVASFPVLRSRTSFGFTRSVGLH